MRWQGHADQEPQKLFLKIAIVTQDGEGTEVVTTFHRVEVLSLPEGEEQDIRMDVRDVSYEETDGNIFSSKPRVRTGPKYELDLRIKGRLIPLEDGETHRVEMGGDDGQAEQDAAVGS